MRIYRKNNYVATEEQANILLDAMDKFVNKPVIGKPQPRLDADLMKIWNNCKRLDWKWSEEGEADYIRRIAAEKSAKAELERLKTDNDYFKDQKLRPWRDQKLVEWIDATFAKPLLYKLTPKQKSERIQKRQELLDWTSLADFDIYKTDAKIDVLKPSAPSWII